MSTKIYPKDAIPEPIEYCGITAPMALWNAVGLEVINWIGGEVEFPRRQSQNYWGLQGATDAELIEARLHTGSTGEAALVWLIQERRRQSELLTANRIAEVTGTTQKKAGDDAIHAARIHRQAAELECVARGIDRRTIDSRLS